MTQSINYIHSKNECTLFFSKKKIKVGDFYEFTTLHFQFLLIVFPPELLFQAVAKYTKKSYYKKYEYVFYCFECIKKDPEVLKHKEFIKNPREYVKKNKGLIAESYQGTSGIDKHGSSFYLFSVFLLYINFKSFLGMGNSIFSIRGISKRNRPRLR